MTVGEPRATGAKASGEVPETQSAAAPLPANHILEFLLARGAVSEPHSTEQTSAVETGPPDVKQNLPESEARPLQTDIEADSRQAAAGDASRPVESGEDKELNLKENEEIALLPEQPQQQEIQSFEETADATAPLAQQQSPIAQPTIDESQLKPQIMLGHFSVDRVSKLGGKTIGFIRVEAEETLGHYAEWLNVSANEIRRVNGFSYGRPLHLSQQIKIPLERVTKEEFEEKRFEFHQELAEDFFTTYRVEKVVTYSIKKGDNIWTLSHQEFEVPLWLIKHYNGDVDFSALIPSQKLLIPIIEKNV